MLKNITWNNIVKFWVALIIIIIFIIYKIITRDPADILLNHLEDKYNKKFEIVLMGKRARGGFYQARVYPKELEKLGKVNDEYYGLMDLLEMVLLVIIMIMFFYSYLQMNTFYLN